MAAGLTRQALRLVHHPVQTIRRTRAFRRNKSLENEVLAAQWLPRDKLREWQFAHVKRLLTHAYQTTAYYRELLDGLGVQVRDIRSLDDFAQAIPPLERSTVKERFDDLVSSKWRGSTEIEKTSGSTGTPMYFAHPEPFPLQRVSRVQVAQIQELRGDERTLAIWGRELSNGGYCDPESLPNTVLYSFFDMPPEGFEELLDFCVEWQPEVVFGYVLLLCTVADGLEARGVTPLKVPIIRTHAERLHDWQREKIARAFGGEVFDHYGSCEISDYGIECRAHQGIHLFSNLRLFELDRCREDEPDTGEVLVTDFANEAMPFIRYRNGDVLTIDRAPCSCGRSLPRAVVQGRSVDMICLRDGTQLDSVFVHELMDPDHVTHYLFHQRTYDRVDLHIVPTEQFSEAYHAQVIARIREMTQMSDIRIILEDELDVEIAGKHRIVRSDVSA